MSPRPSVVRSPSSSTRSGWPTRRDVGGVRLGLVGEDAVRTAAEDLLELAAARGLDVRGLLVEPMAEPGVELIVGLTRDPHFGPAVMVGFGGVFTEVLDDVAIRLAPIGQAEALAMLESLRGGPLLVGARGRPRIDRGAVAALIVGLARFAWERPDVLAVDLNPVVASPAGAVAVDALVVLRESHGG